MPSVLGIDDGRLVAGEDAVRLGPRRTISSIKSALTEGRDEVVTSLGTIDVREGVTALLDGSDSSVRKSVDPDLLDGSRGVSGLSRSVDRTGTQAAGRSRSRLRHRGRHRPGH